MDADVAPAWAAGALARGLAPGVQVATRSPQGAWRFHALGLADVRDARPVAAASAFNLYSLTKTFTALAVLRLAAAGRVELDAPLSRHVGDLIAADRGATVRQTLAHRGGWPNPLPLAWVHLDAERADFDAAAWVRQVLQRHTRRCAAPGARFAYSNIGYLLLGELIARLSGEDCTRFIEREVIAPLGLADGEHLSFGIDDEAGHALGHVRHLGLVNAMLGAFIERRRFVLSGRGRWRAMPLFHLNGAAYGGLHANAAGLARFLDAVLATDARLIEPRLRDEWLGLMPGGVALGWFEGRLGGQRFLTHAGGGIGYYAEMRFEPDTGRAAVLLANASGLRDRRLLDQLGAGVV